jgi:hypothetical protein
MSMTALRHEDHDSPAVAALRKKIRGETLSPEEQAILARSSRKPTPEQVASSIPHEQLMAALRERERLGE